MPQPLKFSCDKGYWFQSVEKVTLLSLRNEAIWLCVSVLTFANLFEIVWLRIKRDWRRIGVSLRIKATKTISWFFGSILQHALELSYGHFWDHELEIWHCSGLKAVPQCAIDFLRKSVQLAAGFEPRWIRYIAWSSTSRTATTTITIVRLVWWVRLGWLMRSFKPVTQFELFRPVRLFKLFPLVWWVRFVRPFKLARLFEVF